MLTAKRIAWLDLFSQRTVTLDALRGALDDLEAQLSEMGLGRPARDWVAEGGPAISPEHPDPSKATSAVYKSSLELPAPFSEFPHRVLDVSSGNRALRFAPVICRMLPKRLFGTEVWRLVPRGGYFIAWNGLRACIRGGPHAKGMEPGTGMVGVIIARFADITPEPFEFRPRGMLD